MQEKSKPSKSLLNNHSMPRRSLELSLGNLAGDKRVRFDVEDHHDTDHSKRIKTECPPWGIPSVPDFWKGTPHSKSTSNLTFAKMNREEEQVKKKYLSKVLINLKTGILGAFKAFKNPSRAQSRDRQVNQQNKWYRRAAAVLAVNSKINVQKSLWRLQKTRGAAL